MELFSGQMRHKHWKSSGSDYGPTFPAMVLFRYKNNLLGSFLYGPHSTFSIFILLIEPLITVHTEKHVQWKMSHSKMFMSKVSGRGKKVRCI